MGVPGLYLDTRERGPVPIGSVLRADFHPDSDIDILVTFAPGQRLTLDHWLKIWEEIETLFDRKVDLVSKEYLKNPYRRHEILNTCQVIYAISRYCFGLGYGAIHSTNSRVKPRWPSNTHPLGRPPVDPAYAKGWGRPAKGTGSLTAVGEVGEMAPKEPVPVHQHHRGRF
ncbi:nucleotidyltransferase family protein [Leptolyngbya sp. PCC 6406]|uniref:nucleotidyltransferase family protein n=1 Tax=Leptolyngbya sp. PCC 6406 TaxID=1173264 RepID=UPI0002ABD92E|nr:nucleotidyltransferase domain-containing protein [Leptolyngbya sp. PCC 6406]